MITIGKISRHHNRNGEIKCLILSDYPERFLDLDRVFLESGEDIKRLHLESVRFHKDYAIIKFEEVDSLVEAQKLKDYYVKLPSHEALELPEGHFFMHDLIGIEVYTEEDDEYIGILEDIITTGSHDIYVVHHGKEEYLIPAIHEIVKEIDVENRKMIIDPTEGLLELNRG